MIFADALPRAWLAHLSDTSTRPCAHPPVEPMGPGTGRAPSGPRGLERAKKSTDLRASRGPFVVLFVCSFQVDNGCWSSIEVTDLGDKGFGVVPRPWKAP